MTAAGWWLWLMLGAVAEVWALSGHGVTLSSVMVGVRNDPIGRWVFWAMLGFLVAHWGQAPRWLGSRTDWRSILGVALGIAVAAFDTWVLHR